MPQLARRRLPARLLAATANIPIDDPDPGPITPSLRKYSVLYSSSFRKDHAVAVPLLVTETAAERVRPLRLAMRSSNGADESRGQHTRPRTGCDETGCKKPAFNSLAFSTRHELSRGASRVPIPSAGRACSRKRASGNRGAETITAGKPVSTCAGQ